jgi:UDP-N-acetylglucosamine 2-epimerase (non-hydrolysing)
LKSAIIIGTRPEIIKMSPIIREYERRKLDYFILHTGQHYSFKMDKIFFNQLKLPQPKYNLDIGSGTQAEQTGQIMIAVEKILMKESLRIILIQGDTNTTLAAALAAAKSKIKTAHIEAGLRSFDKNMPEEINRIVADHTSEYLFAPTNRSKQNLLKEGLNESSIFVTGNTIVDAVYETLQIARSKNNFLSELSIKPNQYFLVTLHRQENVDKLDRLEYVMKSLRLIYQAFSLPLVFPIHPRTKKRIKQYGLQLPEGTIAIEPTNFLQFLKLEASARMVLTDSGGVQEETCILGTPCVTLRDNTERPETLQVGSNVVAGIEPMKVKEAVTRMYYKEKNWKNPFGEGDASKKIVKILQEREGLRIS